MSKTNCIIVGSGDFNGLISDINPQRDLVIAADGGYDHLSKLGIIPDIWIGDGDSLAEQIPEISAAEIIPLPVMKDDTDTLAAVKLAMARGIKSFHIYGGCGGRLDHTIANIKILAFISENGGMGYLYDLKSMLTVITDTSLTFPKEASGTISIFPVSGMCLGVTIEGLKYELFDGMLRATDSIGVSNSFIGKESRVCVERGQLLVVMG